MTADQDHRPRILIVGAGVSGLLLAQGLQRRGIPYRIVETEDSDVHRTKEWTMAIHWSLPLLKQILPHSLAERLAADATVDPSSPSQANGALIYDAVTGKVVKDLDPNGALIRVSRRKLRTLCRQGIQVEYNQGLQNLTCDLDEPHIVTATFVDGSTEAFDLVIGADGPRSTVRNFLVGIEAARSKPFPIEAVHMSAVVSYRDAVKARSVRDAVPIFALALHPNLTLFASVQDVPDPDAPETWKFFFFPAWRGKRDPDWTQAQMLRHLKERAGDLAEPFRSAVLWIPEDTVFAGSEMSYWSPEGSWDTKGGRVTLVGDAAHPMPPYRGQGLNHAIQDVSNILQVIDDTCFKPTEQEVETNTTGRRNGNDTGVDAHAIQSYSDEVARRCGEEVKLSCKNGVMALEYYAFFEDSPYMKHGMKKVD